jgi:hypothetical protein
MEALGVIVKVLKLDVIAVVLIVFGAQIEFGVH